MKYSTYNITIQMLAIATATLLLVPLTVHVPSQVTMALPFEKVNNPESGSHEDFEFDHKLPRFTSEDEAADIELFLDDSEVQMMIDEKPIKSITTGVFTYNVYEKNPKWYIAVNVKTEDQRQVYGLVDIENRTVTKVQQSHVTILNDDIKLR